MNKNFPQAEGVCNGPSPAGSDVPLRLSIFFLWFEINAISSLSGDGMFVFFKLFPFFLFSSVSLLTASLSDARRKAREYLRRLRESN